MPASALDRYIARATLGLPRAERLDTAAELRTHLLERAAQLQAQGFAREEAEYLAVRQMGNVRATNVQLLGHFFTTPLGWGVLALVVLALVGWQAWSSFGVSRVRVNATGWQDKGLNGLIAGGTLPTTYNQFGLTLSRKTQKLYVAWITPESIRRRVQSQVMDVRGGQYVSVWASLPTWRPYWKNRSPLPYADLPWRETCHDEQPIHISAGTRFEGLRVQNSNLQGVLWCSDIPGTGTSRGASYQYSGFGFDDDGVRLNEWLPIFGAHSMIAAQPRGGVLMLAPTDGRDPGPPPALAFDERSDNWTLIHGKKR